MPKILERNISLNIPVMDELQNNITSIHHIGQGTFEEITGILSKIRGVYGRIPSEARDVALPALISSFLGRLGNYSCIEEGSAITGAMQGLAERMLGVDSKYADLLREMGDSFRKSIYDVLPKTERNRNHDLDIFTAGAVADENAVVREVKKDYQKDYQKNYQKDYTDEEWEYVLKKNSAAARVIYAPGIPASVKEQCRKIVEYHVDTLKQAEDLSEHLKNVEFKYNDDEGNEQIGRFADDFCEKDNCIKIIEAFKEFDINTDVERAYFLGQVYAESGERGSYIQLLNDDIDNSDANLDEYVKKNEKKYSAEKHKGNNLYDLTEAVLANHPQLGKVEPSPYIITDELRYRGGGGIHLTNKWNYYCFAKYVEDKYNNPVEAQNIREKGAYSEEIQGEYRFTSAAWYFRTFIKVDLESDFSNEKEVKKAVTKITKKVNGGHTALDKRQAATIVIGKELTGENGN